MSLKKIKRFLAFSLLLAMLLSILPPVAFAADTIESGQYVIAAKVGDTYYAMSNTFASKINGTVITVTDGKVATADAAPYAVTLSKNGSNYSILLANDMYLAYGTSGTNFTSSAKSYDWTISDGTNGTYRIASASVSSRGLVFRAKTYNQFGGYALSNVTATSAEYYDVEILPIGEAGSTDTPSCDHANATSEVATPATCTEDGVRTYPCECGETWEEVIPATGHSLDDGVETVAPGCETDGLLAKTCAICGDTVEEPIPATGHSYVDGICKNCSEEEPEVDSYQLITLDTIKEGEYIIGAVRSETYPTFYPATTKISSGDLYVSETAVTATDDTITGDLLPTDAQIFTLAGDNVNGFTIGYNDGGAMKYLGYTSASSRKLAFDEKYVSTLWTIVADPDGGFALSGKSDLGIYTVSQNSTALGAIRGYGSTTIYTGIYLFAKVENEPEDPTVCIHESKTVTGHKDPSCVENGYDEWTCNTCGETGTDVLFPSDDYHVPGETEVIVLGHSSCYEEGLQEILVRCTVCSRIISNTQETIPTTPHTYGEDDRCTVCSKFKAGKTFYLTNDPLSATYFVIYHPASGTALSLDASGKKLMPSQVTVENGVLTTVENTAVLLRIDSGNEAFPMSMAAHDWSYLTSGETGNALFYAPEANEYSHWNPVLVSEADSTFRFMNAAAAYNGNNNQAIEFYKDLFTVYGVADTDAYAFQIYCDTKPACIHQWDEGEVTLEATCYAEGTLLRTCALCQEVTEEPIPMLDHAWEATEVVPPACYADGYTIYTCFGCGSQRSDDIIPAFHGDLVSEVTPPTCDEQGYTTYTCSLCGFGFTDDFTDPTGHTWTEATCSTYAVCEICDAVGGDYLAMENVADLVDDDRIILVAKYGDEYFAVTNSLNDKNRLAPLSVTYSAGQLSGYDASVLWTLVKTENGFALQAADGYLAYSGSTTTFTFASDPYDWSISKEEGFRIIDSVADRGIIYQAGSQNVFGAYKSSNYVGSNYSGDLMIFKYVTGATLPHEDADKDNRCDNCGRPVNTDANLQYRSITLNGNIGVNFYMTFDEEIEYDEDAYMLFTQEGKEPVKVYLSTVRTGAVRGGKQPVYCFTYEVASKEMTDTITAQFFYRNTCTEQYTYSVRTYANNMLSKLSEEEETLINLLKAMLHYGATSQLQFNYHTERLANEGLEPVDYTGLQIEGFPTNLPQGTDLVSFAGASLLLNSETTLRFFLKVDASVENLTVTYDGTALEIKERNGLYYVDVADIAAPDLDEYFAITVNDGTNTADISYSALAYCASVKANASGIHSETLQNVVAALYLYNQAANNYFSPQE